MRFPTADQSAVKLDWAKVRPSSHGGFVAFATFDGRTFESAPKSTAQTAIAELRLILRRNGLSV